MPDPRLSIKPPAWVKSANEQVMQDGSRTVLTVQGRRSGALRRTPLTVHQVGGQRYLIGGLPAADWIRNVRITKQGTLTTSDETEVVRLVELDPAEAGPILRECPRTTPEGVQMMLDVGLISAPTPEELTGLAGVCPVFRIDPQR